MLRNFLMRGVVVRNKVLVPRVEEASLLVLTKMAIGLNDLSQVKAGSYVPSGSTTSDGKYDIFIPIGK
jgi:hypothetical protein